MDVPATRYARSGDVHIAYQVFGSGPIDLILVPGWISHLDLWWDSPITAGWLERFGRFARVITSDKRGTGLSDRDCGLPTMEQRMADIRAVMDAAESKCAAVLGWSEGGSLAALFAAAHPDRCRALVLHGAFAKFSWWISFWKLIVLDPYTRLTNMSKEIAVIYFRNVPYRKIS